MDNLQAQSDMMKAALLIIAARPTHEGGCYYNNRLSIFEARKVLEKLGVDWIAALALARGEA